MKVLVVYDSQYGNTEQVARAIGAAMDGAKVVRAVEADSSALKEIDLLIIGSPTQGGRHTQAMRDFLDKLAASSLKGLKAAVFDTRVSTKWVGIFGYAAGRIANDLKARGADLMAPPEAFFVTGTKGPLKDGELERAAVWMKDIVKKLS